MKTVGYIYILTNKGQPGLVKIGYADDVAARVKQLSRSTSVAYPFEVYATCAVSNRLTDLVVHRLLDTINPNIRAAGNKEFYKLTPEQAYDILEALAEFAGDTSVLTKGMPVAVHDVQVVQAIQEHINVVIDKERRVPFKFSMIGLVPGDEVIYIPNPTVKVRIIDDNHVDYNGSKYSLSLLDELLAKPAHRRQGPLYFSYNGKPLTEIRDELENNKGE